MKPERVLTEEEILRLRGEYVPQEEFIKTRSFEDSIFLYRARRIEAMVVERMAVYIETTFGRCNLLEANGYTACYCCGISGCQDPIRCLCSSGGEARDEMAGESMQVSGERYTCFSEKDSDSESPAHQPSEGADEETGYSACPHSRLKVCAECERIIAQGAKDGMGGGDSPAGVSSKSAGGVGESVRQRSVDSVAGAVSPARRPSDPSNDSQDLPQSAARSVLPKTNRVGESSTYGSLVDDIDPNIDGNGGRASGGNAQVEKAGGKTDEQKRQRAGSVRTASARQPSEPDAQTVDDHVAEFSQAYKQFKRDGLLDWMFATVDGLASLARRLVREKGEISEHAASYAASMQQRLNTAEKERDEARRLLDTLIVERVQLRDQRDEARTLYEEHWDKFHDYIDPDVDDAPPWRPR